MANYTTNDMLSTFIRQCRELEEYRYVFVGRSTLLNLLSWCTIHFRAGKPIAVDGQTLSVVAIVAAARHHASVSLIDSSDIVNRMARSRDVIAHSVDGKKSVYGVSTGFGGSGEC